MTNDQRTERSGVWFALGAYGIWGLLPLYWKLLASSPAAEILAHRMVWSFGFLLIVLSVTRRWAWLDAVRTSPQTVALYLGAGSLLALNWGLYIWAVNAGYVIETALGYFINPLLNVLLGWLFFDERLRYGQRYAVALAGLGVGYLTWTYGRLPWIALALAGSFGVYGLLKKRAPLRAMEGLTLETALLSIPALGYLFFVSSATGSGEEPSLLADPTLAVLLAVSGIVTSLPLLFFAGAVRRLRLTTVGTIQYLAPTLQFLLGVFLFHEPFDNDRLIGFVFIWSGISVFVVEGLRHRRRQATEPANATNDRAGPLLPTSSKPAL